MTTVTNTPTKVDIIAYQGQPYIINFEWPEGTDFTGETWAAQVRESSNTGRGAILAEFVVTIPEPNVIQIALTAVKVDAIGSGPHKWDLERRHAGASSPETPMGGTIRTVLDQTREVEPV